jgi:hypothetical protein
MQERERETRGGKEDTFLPGSDGIKKGKETWQCCLSCGSSRVNMDIPLARSRPPIGLATHTAEQFITSNWLKIV